MIDENIHIPIFNRRIRIVVVDDYDSFLRDEMGVDTERVSHGACVYHEVNGWFGIIFRESALTHGIIAHEALHATKHILDTLNESIWSKEGEVKFHLLTYIVDEIHKVLGTPPLH